MNRLNNRHIINTIQSVKPLRKKVAFNLIVTFIMADQRPELAENNAIVVKKVRQVRIFSEDLFHSLLPSIFILAMAVTALFHLGWKMTFIVILFAPVPVIINKMRNAKQEKNLKILFHQPVKINADIRAIHVIWLVTVQRTQVTTDFNPDKRPDSTPIPIAIVPRSAIF